MGTFALEGATEIPPTLPSGDREELSHQDIYSSQGQEEVGVVEEPLQTGNGLPFGNLEWTVIAMGTSLQGWGAHTKRRVAQGTWSTEESSYHHLGRSPPWGHTNGTRGQDSQLPVDWLSRRQILEIEQQLNPQVFNLMKKREIRDPTGGPLHHKRECAAPRVLLKGTSRGSEGHRLPTQPLTAGASVCFSPSAATAAPSQQNQATLGTGHPDCSKVAQMTVVPRAPAPVNPAGPAATGTNGSPPSHTSSF